MKPLDKIILDLNMEWEYVRDEIGYAKLHMPGLVQSLESRLREIQMKLNVLQKVQREVRK